MAILFAALKGWRFWIFRLDWRICIFRWKEIFHVGLGTKYLFAKNKIWGTYPSIMGRGWRDKLNLYCIYMFRYEKCLEILYSPLAGYCFRLDQLLGYTFSISDSLKDHVYENNEFYRVRHTQEKVWGLFNWFGLYAKSKSENPKIIVKQ